MPLPVELLDQNVPESTAVVGDIDAFILYIESGQAAKDWDARIKVRMRELEDCTP